MQLFSAIPARCNQRGCVAPASFLHRDIRENIAICRQHREFYALEAGQFDKPLMESFAQLTRYRTHSIPFEFGTLRISGNHFTAIKKNRSRWNHPGPTLESLHDLSDAELLAGILPELRRLLTIRRNRPKRSFSAAHMDALRMAGLKRRGTQRPRESVAVGWQILITQAV